ncbi:two component transcriptional regulator, LytTR family [Fibrisoma limi BUZ 3]|uniref:Two component transcriptional regulator, LytTR family n=1 Tax=Fibrisoma limi BUZ 3 TaxID=1185876 RepID=I2GG82_9BACT|nr:response regulator [Fibrisoma limi]CCH52907.1 two component transcriptional regulator, LytTR family [Fibrisoma limi BUZ 3]
MDRLKILLVEDNTLTALDLQEILEEAGHTVTAVARTFNEALKAVKTQPPDMALVDITLDGSTENGIETAREMLLVHRMPIIYLTADSDHGTFQAAKETMPAAYLLKPFRADELKLQIELAYHYFQLNQLVDTPSAAHLFLPVDKGYEKIALRDVLYLKADGAYVKIFLTTREQPYHISMNLRHLAQYFSASNFFRLSRSLLLNLDYLERLERNYLYIVGHKTAIPIPAASRKELMKRLTVVRTK